MKRKDLLCYIRIAGYHGDTASFTRLYLENRISRQVARAEYLKGVRLKQAGVKCECYECKKQAA